MEEDDTDKHNLLQKNLGFRQVFRYVLVKSEKSAKEILKFTLLV